MSIRYIGHVRLIVIAVVFMTLVVGCGQTEPTAPRPSSTLASAARGQTAPGTPVSATATPTPSAEVPVPSTATTRPPTDTPSLTNTPVPPTDTPASAAPPTPVSPPGDGGGGLIAFSSYRDGESEIYTMKADGSDLTRLTVNGARDSRPAWSPDGTRIVYVRRMDAANYEIFVMNADGSGTARLTTSASFFESEPAWSPDGSRIAFISTRKSASSTMTGRFNVYVMDARGSSQTLVTSIGGSNSSPDWSPDGETIVFDSTRDGNFEIYRINVDGSHAVNLTKRPTNELNPAWSPDGSKVAFVSDRDGNQEIYVMDADGSNQTRLTFRSGDDKAPDWSPDGQHIVFYACTSWNCEIYKMRADGSRRVQLTDHKHFDGFPTWRPAAAATASAVPPGNIWTRPADGLSKEEAATLDSLEQVSDYPLYTMHYYGAYNQRRMAIEDSQWLAHLDPPAPGRRWACSLFTALGDADNAFYGRNFDWRHSPALLLFTDPPDGYAAVSMVDIEYLGFGGAKAGTLTDLSLVERQALLDAPFWPFDGMNEHGLAIGMAAVPPGHVRPDPTKETIDSLMVMRQVLDRARDVDEAIAVVQSYNVDMGEGPPLHYLLADATGRSVLAEFYQGEVVLIPNAEPWHLATNFLHAAAGESAAGECWRYDSIRQRLVETGGWITAQDAIELLAQVSQEGTQWSVVYGMSSGKVTVAMGRQYDSLYTFQLNLTDSWSPVQ